MTEVTCSSVALSDKAKYRQIRLWLRICTVRRFFPCQIWQVPTPQVVRCISACVYAAFYEFPDKISCSNIIGCRKITVISFSILECTETMIARITDNCSWTIIGKPAGIPRTDSGYAHPSPVRLVLTSFFDIPFSLQMQLLFLSSQDSSIWPHNGIDCTHIEF